MSYSNNINPALPASVQEIPKVLNQWMDNINTQTRAAFTRMSYKDGMRLFIVICAYALIIRPFLLRMGAKVQAGVHEKEGKERAKMSANELRGRTAIPGVDSDSDESDDEKLDVRTGQWGRKARLRQRTIVRKHMDAKEAVGLDPEDDKDIEEFLVD